MRPAKRNAPDAVSFGVCRAEAERQPTDGTPEFEVDFQRVRHHSERS
jgi:hypothetical protein